MCLTRPFAVLRLFRVELILILWPIFFVAITREEPNLKPREFKKLVGMVAEPIGVARRTVSLPWPLKRSMPTGGHNEERIDVAEQQIARPYWEPTSPANELPDQRPESRFRGWKFRPWRVTSPTVTPYCENQC